MRFRSEEKATSLTRVVLDRRSTTPNSSAAANKATSVGLPCWTVAFEQRQHASKHASMEPGSPKSVRHSRSPSRRHSHLPSKVRLRDQAPHLASATFIAPCVSVPVLSQHRTSAQPSASTAGSLFTMAFLWAILITPNANVTATQMGRPSGMAATAKETPTVKTPRSDSPRSRPTRPMTTMTAIDAADNFLPRASMPCCRGVLPGSSDSNSCAAAPTSVLAPTVITTALPRPKRTNVPANKIVRHSASGT